MIMPQVYQSSIGGNPEVCLPMMATVKAFVEARGWRYDLIERPAIEDIVARRIASEHLRAELLAVIPGAMWVDHDCELLEGFEYIEDGLPHLPYWPEVSRYEETAQPDSFIAWGPCAYWQALIDECKLRGFENRNCWLRYLLRDRQGITQIPPSTYRHIGYTVATLRGKPVPVAGATSTQSDRGQTCSQDQNSAQPSEPPSSTKKSPSASARSTRSRSTGKRRK